MYLHTRNEYFLAFQLDRLIGKGYFFVLKMVLKQRVSVPVPGFQAKCTYCVCVHVPVALIGSWQVIC